MGNYKIIKSNEYSKENPPDFVTHLNYVSFLNSLSRNLSIQCSLTMQKKIPESRFLEKKINLVRQTIRGLGAEHDVVLDNPALT